MAINESEITTIGMPAWYPTHIRICREHKQPGLHGLGADLQMPVASQNCPGGAVCGNISIQKIAEVQIIEGFPSGGGESRFIKRAGQQLGLNQKRRDFLEMWKHMVAVNELPRAAIRNGVLDRKSAAIVSSRHLESQINLFKLAHTSEDG